MSDAGRDGAAPGIEALGPDSFREAALGNLAGLFDGLDRDALAGAIEALARARGVVVAGAHAAHPFALHLHRVAAGRFDNWKLAEPGDNGPSRFADAPASADALVAIAAAPYAADTVALARRARRAGAHVVAIADRRGSPLEACSDDVLVYPSRGPGGLRSHIGAAVLAEMLVGMVAERSAPPQDPRGRG